jgi:hypothetical protein
MQHIIQKQIIDLSFSKRLNTYHIQQQVSDYYFAKIVPLLEKAFDAVSAKDEMISIDRLTVDLGTITEKEIEEGDWEEKVFKKITDQLTSLKHLRFQDVKVKTKTRSLSISEQWIFYMRHGYLPWNTLKINKQWYENVLEAFASDAVAITNLRNLINENSAATRRIVFQHEGSFLQSLIETLTAKSQDNLWHYIAEISKMISSSSRNKAIRNFQKKELSQKLWHQVLIFATTREPDLNSSKIVALLLLTNLSAAQFKTKKVTDFIEKYKITPLAIEWERENFSNAQSKYARLLLLKSEEWNELKEKKEWSEKEKDNKVDEQGIYLVNAGMVLLHPFLLQFFRNLQFLEKESFKDILSQQKSLYLLHYLATGNTKPQEHELVIAKVLCSWTLEKPVDNLVNLTEKELNESNELLLSAIQQWSILKSTSPNGLREGFFQRKGKLFRKNDALVLQVERGPIDMLLDHLPWNLSIIKLPWMHDILKVEW